MNRNYKCEIYYTNGKVLTEPIYNKEFSELLIIWTQFLKENKNLEIKSFKFELK